MLVVAAAVVAAVETVRREIVDLVVEFAGGSAQKYQRYFAVAVVGSDFDLMVGH